MYGGLCYNGQRPSIAIYSFNSLMTIGAIKAVNALNLSIPKHLFFVSFDDIPGQVIFKPQITYALQPIEDLGRNETKIILERIEHPSRNRSHRVCLKPTLIVGESCRNV